MAIERRKNGHYTNDAVTWQNHSVDFSLRFLYDVLDAAVQSK